MYQEIKVTNQARFVMALMALHSYNSGANSHLKVLSRMLQVLRGSVFPMGFRIAVQAVRSIG